MVITIAQFAVRYFVWNLKPDIKDLFEIVLASVAFASLFRVAWVAWHLDSTPQLVVVQEDKVYFMLGAVALLWVSLESIIRKFSRPAP